MSNESLAHKELKKDAKKWLKEQGFQDNEIKEEYKISGTPRGYIIDVVGLSNSRNIAIELGNCDKLKIAVLNGEMGSIDISFEEVIHKPYSEAQLQSEMYDENSESIKEQKKLLVASYNEEVYNKLKDDTELQFQECKGVDDPEFKIGWFDVWMAIPCATGTFGQGLQYEINFAISYIKKDLFQITINSETNPAVKQYLGQMALIDNREKLLELFHKLPDICYIQPAYKYKTPKRRMPPLPRNWEDTQPYKCNTLTLEQLDEIIEYLQYYMENGSKFEQYPIISIVYAEVRKEDMSKLFKLLKPLYKMLFTFDTLDIRQAKEIHKIPDFNWYLSESKYDMLLDEVKEIHPDISKKKLMQLVRLIKKRNLE